VLADYGTGAIMAVPGQDQRDWDFAKAYDLPVVRTVQPPDGWEGEAYVGQGPAINSANASVSLTVWRSTTRSTRSSATWKEQGSGSRCSQLFRLRDWLLSRQRFWGCPIPVIHCPDDGEVDCPEDQLPVVLPELKGADLKPKGVSPLAGGGRTVVNVECPKCGGPAKRDSDTMDTFVDSSWYFLRYCSPHDDTQAFDQEKVREWMPAEQYVGGVEHAVLHLMYSRFFTKVLFDMGMVDFTEPFTALLNQGVVIKPGQEDEQVAGQRRQSGGPTCGVRSGRGPTDAGLRRPAEDNIDWADMSPAGSLRFLQRAWRLSGDVASTPAPAGRGDVTLRKSPITRCTTRPSWWSPTGST